MARLDQVIAAGAAQRTAGGPWRVYVALPGRADRTYLAASYATKAEAEKRVAIYPKAIRAERAEIRYEG